jgi:hypothetical protein
MPPEANEIDVFDNAFNEAAEVKEESKEAQDTNAEASEYDSKTHEDEKGVGNTDEQANGKKDVKEEKKEPEKNVEEKKEKDPEIGKLQKQLEETEQKYSTLQGMFNQTQKQLNEIGKKKATEEKTANVEKIPSLDTLFSKLYDDLDEKTKKTLSQYEDEFDVPSKAEDIKRTHALKKVTEHVIKENRLFVEAALTEFSKALKTFLDPVVKKVGDIGDSTHVTEIFKAHPDFEVYRDNGELKAWIDEQPSITKKVYQNVYNEGAAKEVIELYDAFKKAKKIGESKKNSDQEEDQQKKEDEEELAKEKERQEKVKNLETVKSKNTGVNVTGGAQNDDFDAAFDEAMKKVNTGRR